MFSLLELFWLTIKLRYGSMTAAFIFSFYDFSETYFLKVPGTLF
jgi:hypothetical protein